MVNENHFESLWGDISNPCYVQKKSWTDENPVKKTKCHPNNKTKCGRRQMSAEHADHYPSVREKRWENIGKEEMRKNPAKRSLYPRGRQCMVDQHGSLWSRINRSLDHSAGVMTARNAIFQERRYNAAEAISSKGLEMSLAGTRDNSVMPWNLCREDRNGSFPFIKIFMGEESRAW